MKKIITALLCLVLCGAAIGGYFIVRHNNMYIGGREALNSALTHAGVCAAELREKDVDFEKSPGAARYDVEFETYTTEYAYLIDARTGAVLSSHSRPRD